MSEWSDGYVSDIGYTFGYYGDLNPNNFMIPFLMARKAVPAKVITACELGFGQGLSINAHASASDVSWFGTDFNPAHASFAQKMANVSEADVSLFDQAFNEFCERDDLPDFDFIGLHGIWSWISHENREILVDFIRRKLKVGGVLYISYNTLPGWSVAAPIRHMMSEHAHIMGSRGEGSVKRVQNSVAFTKDLVSLCKSYQQQAPLVKGKMEKISEQNPHYLAHEYFNRDWHPMYFAEMAEWLGSAKVDYVCSSSFVSDFEFANFDNEQRKFLSNISDPLFSESVKDFMLNKQFRKDYWVKGARTLSPLEYEQKWLDLKFIMPITKQDINLTLSGALGSMDLRSEIYDPIIDCLSDNKIHSVDQIRAAISEKSISLSQLFESLAILNDKQIIHMVQSPDVVEKCKSRCHELNSFILKGSLVNNDISFLISPLIGGAVNISRINQLFLYAYTQGDKDKNSWVKTAWSALNKLGHLVVKDGKTLKSEEENIEELENLAVTFENEVLPFVKNMQLVSFD